MKLNKLEEDVTLKMFVYGQPGAGKTTLFWSAMLDPRTSPVLWLNCMGQPQSIRHLSPLPLIIDIEATKDMDAPYDWLVNGQPPKHKFVDFLVQNGLPVPTVKFKTVVLDGYTEYQRICMDELTGNASKKFGDALTQPDRGMWGQALSKLTKSARLMFQLPGLSVLTSCLEGKDVDEAAGTVTIGPMLWGQAAGEVPGYSYLTMRLVHQTAVSSADKKLAEVAAATTERVGYMAPTVKASSLKEQYGGKLPKMMVNPTIPKIMEIVYGPPNR